MLATGCLFLGACRTPSVNSQLPVGEELAKEFLVVHSTFPVPSRHRLIDELEYRREDLRNALDITLTDEPVHIYLFDDPETFAGYLRRTQPNLADRRAVFEKTDTELRVFAIWGDRVAEDLRHEVTHGYLHGSVPNVPLWVDEGLAEYFETSRSEGNLNRPHVVLLANKFRENRWVPDLGRLEMISRPEDMTQLDYAEAWIWVHFLLQYSPATGNMLHSMMTDLRETGSCQAISDVLKTELPDAGVLVAKHLQQLANGTDAKRKRVLTTEKPEGT